jgi:hypothetical protein
LLESIYTLLVTQYQNPCKRLPSRTTVNHVDGWFVAVDGGEKTVGREFVTCGGAAVSTQDLFTWTPRPQNWRPSDPPTSKAAGISAQAFAADHHQVILSVLRHSGRPMAPEEISDALAFAYERGRVSITLDKVQVCKRVAELLDGGAVERTAEQHVNRSGRKSFRIRIRPPQPNEAASSTLARLE